MASDREVSGKPFFTADERDVMDRFRRSFLESLFRSYVEDGSIPISDRPFERIHRDFLVLLEDFVEMSESTEDDLWPVFDHQNKLLQRAASEVEEGDKLIGVMFYATWFEHFINGMLVRALNRAGHAEEIYLPMIRFFNIQVKLSSTWRLAGLPEIPEGKLRTLNQATELRNAFVHYKWAGMSRDAESNHNARLAQVVSQLPDVVRFFQSLEDNFFWNGREDELISAFRSDLADHERESPPPWSAR